MTVGLVSGRGVGVVIAGLVAGCVLPACTRDDGARAHPQPSKTNATVRTPSPDPGEVAAQRALDAYTGMWRDMATAALTSDYQSPLLGRHAAGEALRQIVDSLYLDKRQNVVTKGQPETHPRVTELIPAGDPKRARIVDCADDSRWLKYRVSGELLNDTPGGRRRITAVVENLNGTWKVTDFRVEVIGSC